ncbi:MAG: carbohydrate ABC transporter permease [Beutenbergiaceae bacterium]
MANVATTTPSVADGNSPSAPPVVRQPAHTKRRLIQVGFLVPAIAYLTLYFGYPIITNFMMASQEYTLQTILTGTTPWVGLDNYQTAVTDPVFRTALLNTFLFTIASIIGQFVLGLAIALFFNRKFALSGFLRSLILLPWLIPMIAASAVWGWILDADNGILNQALELLPFVDSGPLWLTSTSMALVAVILVNIWLGIPFNMTILYGGLQEIPEELYEAGALDGATGWRAFWNITWPLLRPVVTVVLLLGVVYTLKVLDVILGLTKGGPAHASETLATLSYFTSFTGNRDFGVGAAYGNILIVIALVFAVIYLRANRRAVDE